MYAKLRLRVRPVLPSALSRGLLGAVTLSFAEQVRARAGVTLRNNRLESVHGSGDARTKKLAIF